MLYNIISFFFYRIDYTLVAGSDSLVKIQDAEVLTSVEGSDHCPVTLTLSIDSSYLSLPNNNFKLHPLSLNAQTNRKQISISQAFATAAASTITVASTSPVNTNLSHKEDDNDIVILDDNLDTLNVEKNIVEKNIEKTKTKTNENMTTTTTMNKARQTTLSFLPSGVLDKKNVSSPTMSVKRRRTDIIEETTVKNSSSPLLATSSSCVIITESTASKDKAVASQWSALLKGPSPPPFCLCNPPLETVERKSKSPGTLGKIFYVCSKPEGKAGDPNARCDFFRWLK
jgi:hypothetical protein